MLAVDKMESSFDGENFVHVSVAANFVCTRIRQPKLKVASADLSSLKLGGCMFGCVFKHALKAVSRFLPTEALNERVPSFGECVA